MIIKNAKTILFASLIAAMILPFSTMDFAEADNNDEQTKRDVLAKTSKIMKAKSLDTRHGNYSYGDFVPQGAGEHEVFDINLNELRKTHKELRAMPIVINGEKFVVKLVPNRILADPDAEINTFKGKVIGYPDSDVRMFINEHQVGGHVQIDGEYYYIESLRGKDQRAPDVAYVVYKVPRELINSQNNNLLPEADATTSYPTKYLNLITDCDQEYKDLYIWYEDQWKAEQMTTLNGITGLYADANIAINLVSQDSCINDNGIYASQDARIIVENEMSSIWGTNTQFDIVHLFSGKDLFLNGSPEYEPDRIKGKADGFNGVASPQTNGYSVTQHLAEIEIAYPAMQWQKENLVAHEIGHNFGAIHTDQGITVQDWFGNETTENTIMHSGTSAWGSMQWSETNRNTVIQTAQRYL